MQGTVEAIRLTPLQTAVLRTVSYSDIFDYPLTVDETLRNLTVATTRLELDRAVADLLSSGLLVTDGGYLMLAGRVHIAPLRNRRSVSSAELHRTAASYGRFIARLPFVRMVAVTGSLAVDNADPGDDLDYLVVTAKGRVWLTRAMTMLVVRFAALRGVTVCPNYLLSEDALALPDRDFYTARELHQMLAVSGREVHARMLAANGWWREFLPNAESPAAPGTTRAASTLQRMGELLLSLPPFDALEAWLLAHKGAELRRDAGPEAVFDETMCKGHFEGWRERTRQLVDERVKRILEPTS